MSDISAQYSPQNQALVSVSTTGLELVNEENLTQKIKQELTEWFGSTVQNWQRLKTYHLPEALPSFTKNKIFKPKISENIFQCGDHTAYPSLNAAMQTGRQVAEAICQIK